MVYQVLNPLYGMPQMLAHATWSNWLESQGCKKAGYEGAMWSRKDKDSDTILVATHVDDSIVTGSDVDKTDIFVRELLDRFDGTCELWNGSATLKQGLAFCIRGHSRRNC